MSIPTDVRQFRLKHLFIISITLCLPSALIPYSPDYGYPLLMGVVSFWVGMGSLALSDSIDNRPIDDRGLTSQLLNLLGILLVAFSIIGITLVVALGIASPILPEPYQR